LRHESNADAGCRRVQFDDQQDRLGGCSGRSRVGGRLAAKVYSLHPSDRVWYGRAATEPFGFTALALAEAAQLLMTRLGNGLHGLGDFTCRRRWLTDGGSRLQGRV
jgi:hypothetical protein